MIKKIYEGIKLSKKTEKIYELNEKQKEELNKIIKTTNENEKIEKIDLDKLGVDKKEDLIPFLRACKDYIFKNEEYKKKIKEGDLNFILSISEGIKAFKPEPEPEAFFILFKEVFNLYQSGLKQEYIISYTKKISDFIKQLDNTKDNTKDKVVLSNFNILFDALLYLKVNQISQKELEESEDPCKTIDDLLTKSLKSKEMKRDNKYLDIFFEIINRKLQSQQYVILSILVDYLKIISKIKMNNNLNNLNLYHGMLKPILQLQIDKNTYIDCKNVIEEIKKHFDAFYKENKQLMDKIFEIAIEECCQKNNKMNNNALELLEIFFENWSQLIHGSPRGDIKNQDQKSVRPFSASKTHSKKRGDSLYKKKK